MCLRVFAAFFLLYCSLVAALDERCANGKCLPDDHTNLMQVKTSRSTGTQRAAGPLGDSDIMSLGSDFTCASSAANIACWGNNAYGQLGYGDTNDRTQPPLSSDYVDLANSLVVTGAEHTCAVTTGTNAGKVKCWGRNTNGQLGSEVSTNYDAPQTGFVDLGDCTSVTKMVAGDYHNCVICSNNNQVKCWGLGLNGRLGNSNNVTKGRATNTLGSKAGYISLGRGLSAVSLTAGGAHTCAILNNGKLKCWGNNAFGQLGYGAQFGNRDRGGQANEMGDSLPSVSLGDAPDGSEYTARLVVAGASHTCVILAQNNRSKCWGRNDEGQLGYGNSASMPAVGVAASQMGEQLNFVDLGNKAGTTTPYGVLDMAAGFAHTCAIVQDSTGNDPRMKCWGKNHVGQLGYENTESKGKASTTMGGNLGSVGLSSSKYPIAVEAGKYFTCALLSGTPNDMKCWGDNSKGQLGDGSTSNTGFDQNQMSDNRPMVASVTAAP